MNELKAPRGTKDIFYPEIEKWQYLEDKIREFFSRFLYREIRTPIFEHSGIFQRGIGSETEIVQKEMYTFKDKANRSLTLRPENTASVVRAANEKNLFAEISPLRFFYIGPMFRYDKPQKGRYRQFHQFGIEVFGDSSPQVDAEVIYSGYHFLKEINITDIQLLVNSVGCEKCRPGFLNKLSITAQKYEHQLCADCRRKVSTNPMRIFDCKNTDCLKTSEKFPKITDNLCQECQSHFDNLKSALKIFNIKYQVNPKLVRGLDYYTKTAFEIISNQLGAQDSLLGGGRYDNLIAELGGRDMPATGFAAGIERIILNLENFKNSTTKIIFVAYQNEIYQQPAMALAKNLWEKGYQTHMDYQTKNLKKQFKKADRIGAKYTLILGEEEIKKNTISIKNMTTQDQINIDRENLGKWLKENL